MTTGHRPNRHHLGVLNQPTSKPTGKAGLELSMVLEMTLPTIPAPEPTPTPHQSCPTAAHLKITNPLRSPVPNPLALEPAMAAPRPLPGRFHLHHETIRAVDQHLQHATPPRCNRTDIKSDIEASWIPLFTDSSGASTQIQASNPPQPTIPRSLNKPSPHSVPSDTSASNTSIAIACIRPPTSETSSAETRRPSAESATTGSATTIPKTSTFTTTVTTQDRHPRNRQPTIFDARNLTPTAYAPNTKQHRELLRDPTPGGDKRVSRPRMVRAPGRSSMRRNRPGRKFPDESKRDARRSSTPQASDLQDTPSGALQILVLPGLADCYC